MSASFQNQVMSNQCQIDKDFLLQLKDAKPEIRGTTLITYIVKGSTDL